MRIGILGGSFNPPHMGHVHISEVAMKRLGLDCIWWLVTPGNPFKKKADTLPYETRIQLCRDLIDNPRLIVSNLEQQTGTIRSIDTFRILKTRFPGTDFVMLGGMDIAHEIPHWKQWRDLADLTAMAFIARPPETSLVRYGRLRMRQINHHRVLAESARPQLTPGNCYWILQGQLNYLSSTALRRNGKFAENMESAVQ